MNKKIGILGLVLSFVVVVLLAVVSSYVFVQDYKSYAETSKARLRTAASLLEQHVNANFDAARQLLELTADEIEKYGIEQVAEGRPAWEKFREQMQERPAIRSIWIADSDARMRVYSDRFPAPDLNVSDREYYFIHRQQGISDLYVGDLRPGKFTGVRYFPISFPAFDDEGNLIGVVAAAFEPSFFEGYISELDICQTCSIGLLVNRDNLVAGSLGTGEPFETRDLTIGANDLTVVSHASSDTLGFWWDSQRIAMLVAMVVVMLVSALALMTGLFNFRRAQSVDRLSDENRELNLSNDHFVRAQNAARLTHWRWKVGSDKVVWSPGVIITFGFDTDSFVKEHGQYISNFGQMITRIHVEDQDQLRAMLSRVSTTRQSESKLFRVVAPGGEVRFVIVEAEPNVRNGKSEEVTELFGIVQDVTEKHEAQLALSKAKDMADTANTAKTMFLATVSHDIRTPLNIISNMNDMILNATDDPGIRSYAEAIDRAGENLLSLVNDVISVSQLESGEFKLHTVPVLIKPFLEDLVESFRPLASQKGIALICSVDETVPQSIQADPKVIRQIVFNLVGNALKFTKYGSVTVTAQPYVEPNGNGERLLRIVVRDTGKGIPATELQAIFERFMQVDAHTPDAYGSGLGLYICRSLVDLHGGTITCRSSVGIGSVFTVLIPLVEAETPTLEQPASKARAMPEQRVLIADDVEENREILKMILSNHGHRVKTVQNGAEAVDAVRQQDFDIVLLDIRMPVMDGMKALAAIRNDLHKQMPVVAITANALEEQQTVYQEAGFDAIIPKPFRAAGVLNTIASLIDSHQPVVETGSDPVMAIDAPPSAFDKDLFGQALDVLGQEKFRESMALVEHDLNQLEADLVTHGVTEEVKSDAHKLAGSAANFGFSGLSKACLEIELSGRNDAELLDELVEQRKLFKTVLAHQA